MPTNPSLLNGITAFWKLNDASGARVDSVGNFNLSESGTVSTGNFAPQFDPGTMTGTVAVTSGSNALERTNATDLHFGDQDMTVTAWFRPDILTGTRLICGKYFAETNGFNWGVQWSNGFLAFAWGTGSDSGGADLKSVTLTPTPLAGQFHFPLEKAWVAGQWYFVACKHAKGQGIFISLNNGGPVGSNPLDGTSGQASGWAFRPTTGFMSTSTSRFAIGARDSSAGTLAAGWAGGVANVGIWSRLLNDGDIGELYRGGYGLDYNFTY